MQGRLAILVLRIDLGLTSQKQFRNFFPIVKSGTVQWRAAIVIFGVGISAAETTDSDAIHAGDGPLSADERFAEVCVECGIKLITDSDQGGFT